MAHPHPLDPAVAGEQGDRRRLIEHPDPVARGPRVQRLHQFLAAAPDMAGEPAPELELAVDAERLAAEPQLKAHALVAHPQCRLEAAADQDLGQIGVAAILGQPAHVVEILRLVISAEIDVGELVVVDVGDQPREVVTAVIDDAKGAAGKGRVAALLILGGDFEHQHRGTVLPRRECGAGRGIAGPDHDHVEPFARVDLHHPILRYFRPSISPGPSLAPGPPTVNPRGPGRGESPSPSAHRADNLASGRSGRRALWQKSRNGRLTARRG